nr:hypothetical protein [Tanacetum cinerariifolium]
IARSFGLLTSVMVDALSVEPKVHIFKKKSLIAMNVLMDLGRGVCCWPATRQVGKDDEVEETANEEAGGSAEVYRNISQGDWQVRQARWMDQQDKQWGRLDTWMRLYLMRRSLEVLRKFHMTILGGRFNQSSHVLSKLGEY